VLPEQQHPPTVQPVSYFTRLSARPCHSFAPTIPTPPGLTTTADDDHSPPPTTTAVATAAPLRLPDSTTTRSRSRPPAHITTTNAITQQYHASINHRESHRAYSTRLLPSPPPITYATIKLLHCILRRAYIYFRTLEALNSCIQ
jgi:hypothetical protein